MFYFAIEHLGKRLDLEVSKYPDVRLVRAKNRSGLIQARNLGFSQVQTDVAVFLDAHCECTKGTIKNKIIFIGIMISDKSVICVTF